MNREIKVYYTGQCPSCRHFQSSHKPQYVDTLCRNCDLTQNGKLAYVRNARGHEFDDTTVEIGIEVKGKIVVIRCLTPDIILEEKKNEEILS